MDWMLSIMPVVSVIIPTYNRAEILPRAVDSVLRQSFDDLEVIIVDDDSPDQTSEVVDEYSDIRIKYFQHTQNRGANHARNTGIQAATGDYIAFLDDDDKWCEDKLERQLNKFRTLGPSFGLVYSGRRIVEDETIVEEYIPTKSGDISQTLLRKNIIPSETPLIRSNCFDNVGLFDTELESCQDWDMWLRIARSYKVSFVPDILAVSYWGGDDRISRDYTKKCQGYKLLHSKYREEIYRDKWATWYFFSRISYYCILQNLRNLVLPKKKECY